MCVKKVYTCSIIVFIVMLFTFSAVSKAGTIVDTGGVQTNGGLVLDSGTQWLAGQFQLSDTYTIDSIEGWIMGVSGTVSLAVYGDAGFIPDVSDELFRDTFTVTPLGFSLPGFIDEGWFGTSGMNLNLSAGTYWAAFEVTSGHTYDGTMPGTAPNPLPATAVKDIDGDGNWHSLLLSSTADLGLRVQGDLQQPIPEPTTIALLGIGLAGLAGGAVRRKRKWKKKASDKG